jgi:hypothetical protein
MDKKTIVKNLGMLRHVQPDRDFSKKSRLAIVQTPFTPALHEKVTLETAVAGLHAYTLRDLFSTTFRTVLLASATVAVLAGIYFATTQLSPLFLPGLSQNGIIAEADMINATINLQLSHVQRFEQTAKESTAALKEVSTNNPGHLNETIIKTEQGKIDSLIPAGSADVTREINDILKTISQ